MSQPAAIGEAVHRVDARIAAAASAALTAPLGRAGGDADAPSADGVCRTGRRTIPHRVRSGVSRGGRAGVHCPGRPGVAAAPTIRARRDRARRKEERRDQRGIEDPDSHARQRSRGVAMLLIPRAWRRPQDRTPGGYTGVPPGLPDSRSEGYSSRRSVWFQAHKTPSNGWPEACLCSSSRSAMARCVGSPMSRLPLATLEQELSRETELEASAFTEALMRARRGQRAQQRVGNDLLFAGLARRAWASRFARPGHHATGGARGGLGPGGRRDARDGELTDGDRRMGAARRQQWPAPAKGVSCPRCGPALGGRRTSRGARTPVHHATQRLAAGGRPRQRGRDGCHPRPSAGKRSGRRSTVRGSRSRSSARRTSG